MARGTIQQAAVAAGVVPTHPQLLYAPELVTYTHIYIAAELVKECEAYLDAFTGNSVDYPAIVMLILATANSIVFLAVLDRNQVFLVPAVGSGNTHPHIITY